MNYIKEALKGILIGVANIVPGVSGGTLAVSMGIYDKIIRAVSHVFQEPVKSIQTLFPYGMGAGIGVVGLSFLIEYLFANYPLQTGLAFVGLILGGLPVMAGKVRGKRTGPGGFLALAAAFLLVIGTSLSGGGEARSVELGFSAVHMVSLFAVGMIAAATMVIPGVSGSMLLMMMGYYQPIIASINRFAIAGVTLNGKGALAECGILIPLGLGVLTGIFACAKLIELLLRRWETQTYCGIIGLVVASPVVIMTGLSVPALSASGILTGCLCFILTFWGAVLLSRTAPAES